MEVVERTVISPPDYTLTLDGKVLPRAHITIATVLTHNGAQVGKSKPHRAVLEMKPDGTWGFEVEPRNPDTGELFQFTAEDRAAWDSVLGAYVSGYGAASHGFAMEVTAQQATVRVVEYVRSGNAFVRQSEDVVVNANDPTLSALAGVLSVAARDLVAGRIKAVRSGL